MTAAIRFTWDADVINSIPARAASLDDLGSGVLQDHATRPPKPPIQPYAAQLNQWAFQEAGMNRVIVAALVTIHFTAGAPAIQAATAMSSIITTTWAQQAIGGIVVTDNGTGDTTLTWPVGALPPPRAPAHAWVIVDGHFLQPTVIATGSGVRVRTYTNAAAAVDADFCVAVY